MYNPSMPDSIQHFLSAPVPNWLFFVIVSILLFRDYADRNMVIELIERIQSDFLECSPT